MPKQKRVSSAHSACQAKKRKGNQRERECRNLTSHPMSSKERRQRNVEAHKFAHLDAERRQHEQECDTAARRQFCMENPERRLQEQEQNTTGI